MKKTIILLVIVWLYLCRPTSTQAQYSIGGWSIKKSWGALRGNYVDPSKRDLRLIFEDQFGTVRIVSIEPDVKTAVPVVELHRE